MPKHRPGQHHLLNQHNPRKSGRLPLRIFLLVLAALALVAGATANIRGDRWLEDVKYLSSDALKGRGSGSPELTQAANYIADQFKKIGLEPIGGTYFQPFDAAVGAEMGRNNELALAGAS